MGVNSMARRRLAGDFVVDEWGLDPDVVTVASSLFRFRWSLDVSGSARIPETGPALLVFNQRLGSSEPFVVGRAIRTETGRHLRVAGVPDVAVVGRVLRSLGGVLGRVDEVESVLRAGHLAGVGLSRRPRSRADVGTVDIGYFASARRLGAPIHPVAVIGSELRRGWRVEIG